MLETEQQVCPHTPTYWIDSRHLTAAGVGVAMAGGVGRRSRHGSGHAHLWMTSTVLLSVVVDKGLDARVLEELVHCEYELHECG